MQSRGMERFLRKELLVGVQRIEGKGRSVKYIVYFDEVATSKMFSSRRIRRQTTVAGGNVEASIPRAISIVNSFPHMATEELHEQESDDVGDGSSLSCHGIQWKAVDGIAEDWRSSPQFGTLCFLCGYLDLAMYAKAHARTIVLCALKLRMTALLPYVG